MVVKLAKTYIPDDLIGWWGSEDSRMRCVQDDKVVFASPELAEVSASKIRADTKHDNKNMVAYRGRCGHMHVGHSKQ